MSGGTIIGQSADYVIYGTTPTYLVAAGVPTANADLVTAGQVVAFKKATGTPVPKSELAVVGAVSADTTLFGSAQRVTYTVTSDISPTKASGTVDFYVSGGTIIGQSAEYIIYGVTPQYLVAPGVAAVAADPVLAGQVTAFNKTTGFAVPKGNIQASGTVSDDPALFGTKQQITYTVAIDTATPKASGTVDFYVSGGTIIGQSAEYVIYGATPQYLVAPGVAAANADLVAAGAVTAFRKATGAPVAKGDIEASGLLSGDSQYFGMAQPVTYTVKADPSNPPASGQVKFYVSGGAIIGQNADYVIYGATPQYLVAPGVAAANADLVLAGAVTAFRRATGAQVAKGDIEANGSISDAVGAFGTAQPVVYTVRGDTGSPRAQGTVDFYVSGGAIIGQNADYVIYGTTPQYLVAPGVAAANADLVLAGAVTAFRKATGAPVAKGDIEASGSISDDVGTFGTRQAVTYTVRGDTGNPQAIGTVDFFVSGGSIIGQNADYVIYGVTPQYLVAPGVAAANADRVQAGQVTAFKRATGAKVAKTDIEASGSISADVASYGSAQSITYMVRGDTGSPRAQGTVDFYVSGGTIIGQNDDFVIYGVTPTYLVAPDVASANADLVLAGAVTAFRKATGAPVAKADILASGSLSDAVADYGTRQPVTYAVRGDTGNPQAIGTVDFYVSGGSIIGQNAEYVIYGATPQYLVASGVAAANADLVSAGQVTAFRRATGDKVAKTDNEASGSISADVALFGTAQNVTYTVRGDTGSPKAIGIVGFFVSGGAIIGQNADYVIYGETPQYLVAPGVTAANADLVLAGKVTAFYRATGAKVAKTDLVVSGSLTDDVARFGIAQPITYAVRHDNSNPKAAGIVDFYVNGGSIIGQTADYVIYGSTPQYLVAAGVAAANADLVEAGAVAAFNRATGAKVAKTDIQATGTLSADVADFGTKQTITYTVAVDLASPQASGPVDFYVSGGSIIGETADYVIYGTTPQFLVAPGVPVANADLVQAGAVTAFNKATGGKVAKGDIRANGALSAAVADFGTKQTITYTVAVDPASPQASGAVDFYVSGGSIIGQNAEYVIYGATPQYLVAAGVPAANADLVLAGAVTAYNKTTGAPVAKGDIQASGALSAAVADYGSKQTVTYTVNIGLASPPASGSVDFYVNGGAIIGQNANYVIYGVTPTYLVAAGVPAANADLVHAGAVTAYNKATGAKVDAADISANGTLSAAVADYGKKQTVIYTVAVDPSSTKASGSVDFYVSAGAIIGENQDYVIYGVTPTYLVAPGVSAANADLVQAGTVTAFNRATGAPVAKADILATGSVSADVALFGTAQTVTYTIRGDAGSPQAIGTVNFFVSAGTIIGQNTDYVIYGTTPQ
ncbi:MAG: hypothetical protein LBG81_02250 [Coriobacteriaceae bacterium]|nr:hypothetical protein [Coriobacteriaceae bacterium]